MNATSTEHQFTDNEDIAVADYRPVSRFAIVAWAAALLSWLALVHPLMLIIPLVGTAASLIAYWQSKAGGPARSGSVSASAAMFVCILFATWAVTATTYEQRRLSEEAKTFAMQWLKLVSEGKLHEAHQLVISEDQRALPGVSFTEHYAPRERKAPEPGGPSGGGPPTDPRAMLDMMSPSPLEQYQNFFGGAQAKRLAELAGSATYQYLRTVEIQSEGPQDTLVKQMYGVEYSDGGESHRFVIRIIMQRSRFGHMANWRVDRVDDGTGR